MTDVIDNMKRERIKTIINVARKLLDTTDMQKLDIASQFYQFISLCGNLIT